MSGMEILRPVKDRDKIWMGQNILDLHDEQLVNMAWDLLINRDDEINSEIDIKLPLNSTRNANEIAEERLWGKSPDTKAINLQKSSVFRSLQYCYQHNFMKTPLRDFFIKCMFVNRRYYMAVQNCLHMQEPGIKKAKIPSQVDNEISKRVIQSPLGSLAEVGSKVAMSFAFTFLRRAWRTSEDSDLCTDLLQDTLQAFRASPPMSMYDTSHISQTWLTVLEKSQEFLKTVALGELVSGQDTIKYSTSCIPVTDQHLAINLLLEFVLQTGKLSILLDVLLFLLNMWEERKQSPDVRKNPQLTSGPVLYFVKQIRKFCTEFSVSGSQPTQVRISQMPNNFEDPVDFYLNSLHFPEEDDICINYQQAVVVALSFLNRTVRNLFQPERENELLSESTNIFEKTFSKMASYKVYRYDVSKEVSCLPGLCDVIFHQIVCGDAFNAGISDDGNLYVFGHFESWTPEGLQNASSIDLPLHIKMFGEQTEKFTKLAMNPKSSFFLALSESGDVYACGKVKSAPFAMTVEFLSIPAKIDSEKPIKKKAVDIACGKEYILIVTEDGKCYSWFEAGAKSLSQHSTQSDLDVYFTTKFATSSFDTTAVALTDEAVACFTVTKGGVLSWDEVIRIKGVSRIGFRKVHAGHSFIGLISDDGRLYVSGTDIAGLVGGEYVENEPMLVRSVRKVYDIVSDANGVFVIDDFGDVYYWNYGSVHGLKLVDELSDKKVLGMCSGNGYYLVWGFDDSCITSLPENLPFVLQPNQETLTLFDRFLTKLCTNLDINQPLNQEKECMLVSIVNLLHFQLQEIVIRVRSKCADEKTLIFQSSWSCVSDIKKNIIFLASTPGVTSSVRIAAQRCLSTGWKVLLPEMKERALALVQILESTNKSEKPHESQVFLIDLLIRSLTDGNAIEILLNEEVLHEFSHHTSPQDQMGDETIEQRCSCDLMGLVSHLLKKVCRETDENLRKDAELDDFYPNLHQLKSRKVREKVSDQNALTFLLKFLTIITSHALDLKSKLFLGCSRLLKKLMLLLGEHVMTVLKTASSVLSDFDGKEQCSIQEKQKMFFRLSLQLERDAGCALLSPLITSLVLTEVEQEEENHVFYDTLDSHLMSDFSCIKDLAKLLKTLDYFNSLAPGALREDESAMRWINANKESSGEDKQKVRTMQQNKDASIGKTSIVLENSVSGLSSVARSLAIFLSMHLLHYQRHFLARKKLKNIPSSILCLFKNSLCDSVIGSYRGKNDFGSNEAFCHSVDDLYSFKPAFAVNEFLSLLLISDESPFQRRENGQIEIAVKNFLKKFDHHCKKFGYVSSGANETKMALEQLGKCYLACLLKHNNLSGIAFEYGINMNSTKNSKTPTCIIEICRIIARTKLKIVQEHQSSGKSYSEICYPLLDRLNFLLTEVASPPLPYLDYQTMKILRPESRWRKALRLLKQRGFKLKTTKVEKCEESYSDTKLRKAKFESTNVRKKSPDYWTLIYSIVTCKSKFKMLMLDLNGMTNMDEKITNAITEFLFHDSLDISLIRDALLCSQASVQNATEALHEVLNIFREKFLMPSTSFCLQITWNSVFDSLYETVTAHRSILGDAENTKNSKSFKSVVTTGKFDSLDNTAVSYQDIPSTKVEFLKYKLAQKEFIDWSIDKFRKTATDALSMAKSCEKYPDNANDLASSVKSSMADQQLLILQTKNLLVELQSLHFLWYAKEGYMTQSMLFGCQAIFERILTILKEFGIKSDHDQMSEKNENKGDLQLPQVIAKRPELEAGPKLVNTMIRGTKVVRGRDWKWDDQDGCPPGEGYVLDSPEDGWVRVRWPTGIINSYRMGKDDKYDVKLASPKEYCTDHEEGHSCHEVIQKPELSVCKKDQRLSTYFPLRALKQACSSAIQMQFFDLASNQQLDEGAARIASKRFYHILNPKNSHPLLDEFHDSWTSLQFVRTLVSNDKIMPFFVTQNWIDLLQDLIGHDFISVASGNIQEQVQATWLLDSILSSPCIDHLNCKEYCANGLFKTLGLLALGVKSLQDEDNPFLERAFLKRNSRLPGLSPYADHAGNVAEHIIDLLRKLHSLESWRDVISMIICGNLQQIPQIMKLESVETADSSNLPLAFGVVAMIARVDKRLCIGGNTFHDTKQQLHSIGSRSFRNGIVTDIKDSKNEVAGYFYDDITCGFETIENSAENFSPRPPNYKFDWQLLSWSNDFISTCNNLLNIVLGSEMNFEMGYTVKNHISGVKRKDTSIQHSSHSPQEIRTRVCKFHLFIYLLRSLPILLQSQRTLRTVIKHDRYDAKEKPDSVQPPSASPYKDPSSCAVLMSSSSSCPHLGSVGMDKSLRKTLSESDLSNKSATDQVVMLPLEDIKEYCGSLVLGKHCDIELEVSEDATEATDEYQSWSANKENALSNITEDAQSFEEEQNTLQELLSLAAMPTHLKPLFTNDEIEEAVSSLLLFLESSSEQQNVLQEHLEKLNILKSVLDITDNSDKKSLVHQSQIKESLNGVRRDRSRSSRRARQIQHVRANESLHDNSLRYHLHQRLRRHDRPRRPSDLPRSANWPQFFSTLSREEEQSSEKRSMENLIPSDTMQTLKDMGFKDKHIFAAYKELNKSPVLSSQRDLAECGYVFDIEIVVAWLLENPLGCIEDSSPSDEEVLDGFTIIENDVLGHNEHIISEEVFQTLGNNNKTSSSDSDSSDDGGNRACLPIEPVRLNILRDDASASSFLAPEDFSNVNDYARYVRSNIKVGMLVKCCQSYEDVREGDTGRVLKLDHDGLHDLNIHAAWVSKGGPYWVRYIHVQIVRDESKALSEDQLHLVLLPITVGDMVRVKSSVGTPKYKWGLVKHDSVGRVTSIQGRDVVVHFEEQRKWTGLLSELEKVPEPHPNVACGHCQINPIVGPRYKCTICFDYSMCSACFGRIPHASARHVFDMIEKPKARIVRTTASFPAPDSLRNCYRSDVQNVAFCPSPGRLTDFNSSDVVYDENATLSDIDSTKSPKMTTSWKKLVDRLDVSSNENTKNSMIDGNDNTFWKSSSKKSEHKLMLSMKPGAIVSSLVMQVDASDKKSMPVYANISLSGADKKSAKSRCIAIQPHSKFVLLLRDCDESYPLITVTLQNDDSFNCKVVGLLIKGHLHPLKGINSPSTFSSRLGFHDDVIEKLFLTPREEISNQKKVPSKMGKQRLLCSLYTKVYVWGLNDKDQLGGPKGAKVKTPYFSDWLSSLKVSQIIGGSKSLFVVTQEGKIYSCGESTSGRLGLGMVSSNVAIPTFVSQLSSYFVTKVAVHSGGRHAMALTSNGTVFSWGDGEDGKLGHCNRTDCYKPRLITTLKEHHIVDIACGSSHSGAVTVTGKLYTWGQGNYGRLGHGDNTTHLKPKLVTALQGIHVTNVACGSRDAQTLCLTKKGCVYSWGDGDFGKLGRGGSDGCATPLLIDRLSGKEIIQIECGAQFSLALSKSGKIWTWGKGDYFRLGHGHDGHVRYPNVVEGLKNKKVVKVAVGALHCLALTEDGTVYAWGDNDHGQQGNSSTTVNRKPAPVEGLGGVKMTNIACGSSHSIAWSVTDETQENAFEPVRFSVIKDCLGQSYAPHCDPNQFGLPKPNLLRLSGCPHENSSDASEEDTKDKDVSLTHMVLSLGSYDKRTSAFETLLHSLRVNFARCLLTKALTPSKYTKEGFLPRQNDISGPTVRGDEDSKKHADIPGTSQNLDEASMSTSVSSSHAVQQKLSNHAMASLVAETITTPEEITVETPTKEKNTEESEICNGSLKIDLSDASVYSEFGILDAKRLATMLKLSVAGRTSLQNYTAISHALLHLIKLHPKSLKLLLNNCVEELEEITNEAQCKSFDMRPIVQESTHPYLNDCELSGSVKIPGSKSIRVEFDSKCSTETRHDVLVLYAKERRSTIAQLSGREPRDWSTIYNIEGDEISWSFKSDASVNGWGWKFTVYPICSMGHVTKQQLNRMGDQQIFKKPIIAFASHLLELILPVQELSSFAKPTVERLAQKRGGVIHSLVKTLVTCICASPIDYNLRIWAVERLQNICAILRKLSIKNKVMRSIFKPMLHAFPTILSAQYQYEEPSVRSGNQLMYSPFLRELLMLACDLDIEKHIRDVEDRLKLAPFSMFFIARKTMDALVNRQPLPAIFLQRVYKKLDDMLDEEYDDSLAHSLTHEFNDIFTLEMDEQLVNWLNSSPSNWMRTWGGSGQIFGWGHNHRGQLGGIDGAKIKVPTLCSTLISLQPISLAGGEQTLYAVTADGKIYATGYGASGRLGIGSSESIALPTLLESIRHVHITKVSVNSGGKHILALSREGEVYCWGEGGDGKLGHGSRTSCDRPRVIESLRGVDIIDICAGGAHSAAISKDGQLYTWGKGRYGRLGHGDSEDRLKPKLVEFLAPFHVRKVACGSGDAQTLCVTDINRKDANIESEGTMVWSWGDGDYGKLGRGGSEMSKIPVEIEMLRDKHIISVKCGSQFSLALSKTGLVYTWGKGDYYRLGHGSDQHVRYPKVIEDLIGKKVVDVSAGSLHCVVCTEDGEVYAWGDNDEGQIGDGTTQAAQCLSLIKSLSGQGIDHVACGSAHSVAWSTGMLRSQKRGNRSYLPSSVPIKYNLLQGLPIPVLRNRLILLNQFSDILCNSIPFQPLMDQAWRTPPSSALGSDFTSTFDVLSTSRRFPDVIRGLLINSGKECFFRKIVQTTMIRDKQHGPCIELDRIEIKEIKKASVPLSGLDFLKTVFSQAVNEMEKLLPESVLLPHRVWKVKFVGESVDDCGGGYSESIAEMCDELENGSVPLLTQTPNGRDEAGANRDCFLLLPPNESDSFSIIIKRMLKFLGILIGIAIRSGSPLSLNLAEPFWKQLSGQEQCLTDISEVDKDFLPKLMFVRDARSDELESMNLPFTIQSTSGKEILLSRIHSVVTVNNRNEYIRQAIQYRLHEFDHYIDFVRDGIAHVVPLPLISLFTGNELETMACGSPDIPLSLLKSVASFKGSTAEDNLQKWFWEIMESMTNEEKSLFLRFVWGRTRLPRTIADFRGRDFVIQVLDKYNPSDQYLPESYTCFFLLKLPRYSSKAIMDEKLKYAIYFCKSIDTDEYARFPVAGDDDEEDLEDLIATSNNNSSATRGDGNVTEVQAVAERLRSQVTTTSLSLLSRYSSTVSNFLRRRRRIRTRNSRHQACYVYSSASDPDSLQNSDDEDSRPPIL